MAVGAGLVWFSLHVPSAAPALLGAAAALGVWAFVSDGPLGLLPLVGLTVHRRGLIVIAVGVGAVPLLTGDPLSPSVLVPCLGAAILLLRVALVRIGGTAQAGPPPAGGRAPAAPRTGPTVVPNARRTGPARAAGRVTGRRMLSIRAAGRIAGRVMARQGAPSRD